MSDLEQMLNIDLSTDIVTESEFDARISSYIKKEDNAISDSSWISDRLIGGEKIELSSISTDHIADSAIATNKIKVGAVTGLRIANQTMLDSNFSDNSINGSRLKANTVAGAANDQLTSDPAGQIAYETIGTVNLRNEAVTEDKLAQEVKKQLSLIGPLSASLSEYFKKDQFETQTTSYIQITGANLTSQTLWIDASPYLVNSVKTIAAKLSGISVDGIAAPVSDGIASISLSDYALSSDLNDFYNEVSYGLSDIVVPKLDTIEDLVSSEVSKLDSISASLSDYVSKVSLKEQLQSGLSSIDLDDGSLTLKQQLQSIVSVLSGLLEVL